MKLEACGITDVGCVRTNNEDNFLCDSQAQLFVVCDGMGGHAAGEVASELACALLSERIGELRQKLFPKGTGWSAEKAAQLTGAMQHVMAELSQHIVQAGANQAHKKGMGTTCTALWFADEQHAIVAHIGDSRLYLSSPWDNGVVTSDHTLVEELVARGLISVEEAKRHPQAHILSRALGASSDLGADCFAIRVAHQDSFLLCSDGLHAYLPDTLTLSTTSQSAGPTLHDTLQRYIDVAKSQGGHDNLTGVLVRIDDAAPERGDAGQPALAALLQLIASHPALSSLPPMLLRRVAAYVVPLAGSEPAPAAGICWIADAFVASTEPEGRRDPPPEPAWVAPEPLGLGRPAASNSLEAPAAALWWHLPATALMEVVMAHPASGSHILGGLVHESSLADHSALGAPHLN